MDKSIVVISIALIILILAGFYIYGISKKPKEEQIEALKYWLRKLVAEAEGYFGSGTGQMKLAYVYNLAVQQFPWITRYLTYEEFDKRFVKAALGWLNEQIATNPNISMLFTKQIVHDGGK